VSFITKKWPVENDGEHHATWQDMGGHGKVLNDLKPCPPRHFGHRYVLMCVTTYDYCRVPTTIAGYTIVSETNGLIT
jgi:hypothetical protein